MNQQAVKDLKLYMEKEQIQSIGDYTVMEWLLYVTDQLVEKLNPTFQEDYDALLYDHLVKYYDLNEQWEAFLKPYLKYTKNSRDVKRNREEYEKAMEECYEYDPDEPYWMR